MILSAKQEPFYLSARTTTLLARDASGQVLPQARLEYHESYVRSVFNVSQMKPGQVGFAVVVQRVEL